MTVLLTLFQKACLLIREPYVVKKQYNLIQISISCIHSHTPHKKYTYNQLLSFAGPTKQLTVLRCCKSIKIFQFGSQFRQRILLLIIIQRQMLQQTPSVQFELQDYNPTTTVNQVVLQFSNTNNKNVQQIECEDAKQIKKVLSFQNTPPTLEPDLFYQQFQNNFIVSFDNAEQLLTQELQRKSIYPLSQPHTFNTKNQKIHLSDFNLSNTVQSTIQDKEIKSEIITKKGLPNFQIRPSRKRIQQKQTNIDNKVLPNTCRSNKKKAVVCFTSKATPQDSVIAKKLINKYEKDSERIQNKSLFQLNNKIKQFWASKNPQQLINNLSSQIRKTIKEQRVNIFQKLPLIR